MTGEDRRSRQVSKVITSHELEKKKTRSVTPTVGVWRYRMGLPALPIVNNHDMLNAPLTICTFLVELDVVVISTGIVGAVNIDLCYLCEGRGRPVVYL